MEYKDRTLIFEEDKIYYRIEEYNIDFQVMMNWEDSIMKAKADYVCENGGDILEVGFGMGISADYIQANNPSSHTIVEVHPQVIEKLKAWAKDKTNVTIIEGDWFDIKDSLSTYDGILFDTWSDDNRSEFVNLLPSLAKANGRATWWNNFTDSNDPLFINGTIYEAISVNPVNNMYFNSNTYYLPKKQF